MKSLKVSVLLAMLVGLSAAHASTNANENCPLRKNNDSWTKASNTQFAHLLPGKQGTTSRTAAPGSNSTAEKAAR